MSILDKIPVPIQHTLAALGTYVVLSYLTHTNAGGAMAGAIMFPMREFTQWQNPDHKGYGTMAWVAPLTACLVIYFILLSMGYK